MSESENDLTKIFQIIMILAGLVILIQAMMFAKAIVVPFMLAVVIAIIFMGPREWLGKNWVCPHLWSFFH